MWCIFGLITVFFFFLFFSFERMRTRRTYILTQQFYQSILSVLQLRPPDPVDTKCRLDVSGSCAYCATLLTATKFQLPFGSTTVESARVTGALTYNGRFPKLGFKY